LEHHVTVAIVDDHPVVVEGVISWISADPGRRITVTQVVSDITGLTGPRAADVLILDLELGGRMVADEVARLARQWLPDRRLFRARRSGPDPGCPGRGRPCLRQ